MANNVQKGNIYLLLTIIVATFLTVGTVVYLNFPEEKEKFEWLVPPKDQLRQREIKLTEVMELLKSPLPRELSESEKKALEKTLNDLSKDSKKAPEIQKEILDSLIPSPI